MAPDAVAAAPQEPNAGSTPTLWQTFRGFLLRYRIRISLVVFFALIAEDFLNGVKPHNLLNLSDMKSMFGLVLIVSGLALRSWAAGILHKTVELTTWGPYALIRHPLYVGSFLMMIGICLLIDDVENIWFVLGPFLFLYVVKVLHEERVLASKFGARWQEYAAAVPRFVPYRLPEKVFAKWDGQQWLSNREYNALAATALGLVAIQAWAVL